MSRIPASTADPAAGASVCASGSQVWNGNSGVFTASPRPIASRTRPPATGESASGGFAASATMSKVRSSLPRNSPMKPTSSARDPMKV